MDGRFIEASINNGAKAIVLEAFGRGNVPITILPSLEKALAKNILIILISRTYTGRVLPEYGYQGGGLFLQKMGILLGIDLPGPKMRIRLMALFGKFNNVIDVKKYLLNFKEH